MATDWKAIAQARKARRIADILVLRKVGVADAAGYSAADRARAAAEAGTRVPSDEVWGMVLDRLPKGPTTPELFPSVPARRTWVRMNALVSDLSAEIERSDPTVRFEWGGSYRRKAATCGDLDLVVVTQAPLANVALPPALRAQGSNVQYQRTLDVVDGPLKVDVWRCGPDQVGPFMCFVTGPVDLNIAMRAAAFRDHGWVLNQFGLFDETGGRVDDQTEPGVFEALGWPWIQPEERDNWRVKAPRKARKL